MGNIVIVGASQHAQVVIEIVELEAKHQVAGLLDKRRVKGEEVFGYPVLGTEQDLMELRSRLNLSGILIGIGNNHLRENVARDIEARCPDIEFIVAKHPEATISDKAKIGPGSVVMAGAVINPGTRIGKHGIVNTGVTLDHDNLVADFVNISPGITTGENCRINNCANIGIGATLVPDVSIGENAVVGAGSLVLKSVDANTLAYGNPAQTIRQL